VPKCSDELPTRRQAGHRPESARPLAPEAQPQLMSQLVNLQLPHSKAEDAGVRVCTERTNAASKYNKEEGGAKAIVQGAAHVSREVSAATPRFVQYFPVWFSEILKYNVMTLLEEWPVVAKTPFLSEVLYNGDM